MQKTEDLYTQFATTVDLRKYFSEHCRAFFLLDNCIFGLRFNNSKDPSDELDLSYWENWKMQLKEEESRVPSIHRDVTGILNNSYGIIWDTAETIVSRSFDDETIPVRWVLWNIFQSLIDENIKKV
ncbi:17016_t:CDS:2 [Gigaspora margarita]|uniref:17016_t:CDS:1 n=1 Tax=Gigaspora margarita TaxID=4874 RepID=A0ABN7W5G4_GIGMA|nr:17016_t:CDS:2 [Gigaspora margarita]